MTCCTNCGYTTIDPTRSRLVQLATKLFSIKVGDLINQRNIKTLEGAGLLTPLPNQITQEPRQNKESTRDVHKLIRIPSGERVQVFGLGEALTPSRRTHLQAYGVVPGYWIEVIQQSPVTVIQVDHIELALDYELAASVLVTYA
jgi:Fe2+ transport system protein FeoA